MTHCSMYDTLQYVCWAGIVLNLLSGLREYHVESFEMCFVELYVAGVCVCVCVCVCV